MLIFDGDGDACRDVRLGCRAGDEKRRVD